MVVLIDSTLKIKLIMNKLYFYLVLISLIISSCKQQEEVDLIIYNTKIYSVDSAFNIYQAMAIRDGKIVALGTDMEIKHQYYAEDIQYLPESVVYPGFIDAHCHFYGYGLSKERYADLVGTSSFEDMLEQVKKYRASHPEQEWILGRGWDQNDWAVQDFPNNQLLNELYPDIPVLLIRIDGHAVLVNQKALDITGFNEQTKISGGDLLQKDGKLSGVLLDNAADAIKHLVPSPDDDLITKSLMHAQKDCFSVGLTGVMDAGLSYRLVQQIDKMQKEGALKMRMDVMLNPSKKNFETYIEDGIYKTDYLIINSVKLYADGALGSRGACLLEPYSDDIYNKGFLIEDPLYYDSICEILYKAGFQVNTHAIGDSAVRMVLKTYAKYLKGNNDRRWRIEHSQVVSPDDFHFFGDYSIIPAVNTTHATSDMYWAEERLGPTRIKTAYAYHQLLEQNGWLTNGSDFPVESINPLYGFYAAVARKDQNGWPKDAFQPENRLSREEALKAMTIWAAKGSFLENERGSLEPGKFADFVVLDRDIMEVPENELFDAKVELTFIDGKIVH
jgi:predicted amidohydrolase YtcJ